MKRSLFFFSLLASGCSLIDPTDAPAIRYEERFCNTNADCLGIEDTIQDLDMITTLQCADVTTACNAARNRCEVRVEIVEDADDDGFPSAECVEDDEIPDCDDTRPTVFPGATREACDGVVSDCSAPGGGTARLVEDADGDRFSPPDADCVSGGGGGGAYPKTDCDDQNPNTYPGAVEACDGEINTCDALGDRLIEDMDGDGHSPPGADCQTVANNPNVFAKDDCDDADVNTYPGAPEVCDRRFNDCSSTLPRVVEDADNDGRASFLASCEGGPIPKDECVGADLDPTTRYCAPTEMSQVLSASAVRAVAALDYEGDGDVDVLASNGTNRFVCTSNGSSEPMFTCSMIGGGGALRFRVGNADAAGQLDVFLSTGGNVSWFTTGGALAASPLLGGTVFNLYNAAGDAISDVVAVVGTTVVVARNVAGNIANDTVVDPSIAGVVGVAAGDFDGDGVEDVVATTLASAFLYRSASQPFGTWTKTTLPGTFAGAEAVEVGDLDDDGDLDFVIGNKDSGEIVAYLNAAGVFTPVNVVPSTATQQRLFGVTTFELRDYDLDGDLDIGATSVSADTVAWWETAGSSIWLRHDVVTDFDDAGGLGVGDLDGDGDEDLVASSVASGSVVWWRTHYVSGVEFTAQRVDRSYDGAVDAVVGDVDADGDLDIAAVGVFGGDVTVFVNLDGRGQTLAEVTLDLNLPNANSVKLADLDGDEDLDVVALGTGGAIRWYENDDGIGRRFNAGQTVVTGLTGAQYIAVGDLDGDELPDVVATAGTSLHAYVQDGAGGFTPSMLDTGIGTLRDVAVGDMDGDGDLDIVVASAGMNAVFLFTNNGALSFARTSIAPTALTQAFGLALGDVDRNGRLDVVAAGTTGEIRVLLNETAGFESVTVVAAGTATSTFVEAADMDGDGDLDVVASYNQMNTLRWYESTALDGSKWFPHPVSETLVDGAGGLDVGDIDGDGNADVVSTARFTDDVEWWKNDGAAWWNP